MNRSNVIQKYIFCLLPVILVMIGSGCGRKKEEPPKSSDHAVPVQTSVQNIQKHQGVENLQSINKTSFLERIQSYVERGGDVHQFIQGKSYLSQAVWNDDVEAVRLLLESGANVNQKNPEFGFYPIFYAIKENMVISRLVEPTENAPDEVWQRYRLLLQKKESLERSKIIFNVLVSYGADIHVLSGASETPLHMAIRKGRNDLVAKLITYGADVHAWSRRLEMSPIMYAGLYGNAEAAEMLIQYGAHVHDRNAKGQTAMSLAQERRHEIEDAEGRKFYPFRNYDRTMAILKKNNAR